MLNKPLLRLHLNGFSFTPKLLPTLVTFLLLPLLIYLGFWQIQRAHYKESLLTQYNQRTEAQPLTLAEINAAGKEAKERFQYFPVALAGRYDNQHNLLLDNKTHQGKAGYQVLTPFVVAHSNAVVLVNRGWITLGPDRRTLPIIPDIKELQQVKGMVYFPSQKQFVLSNITATENWPMVIQTINLSQISQAIGHLVSPWLVLLSPMAANGFVREWNPVTVSPNKNYGYAVQWFGLAITLLIIFIVVNVKKDKK